MREQTEWKILRSVIHDIEDERGIEHDPLLVESLILDEAEHDDLLNFLLSSGQATKEDFGL